MQPNVLRKMTLILLVIFSFTLFAQGARRVLVYLKDGRVIRGATVLWDPDKLIKLRTVGNNFLTFKNEQIDSITVASPAKIYFKSGYFNLTEIGDLVSPFYYRDFYSYFSQTSLSAINISSWLFPGGFSTGFGAGFEYLDETYLPVVADFRYFSRDKGNIPFLSLQVGYSIPLGSGSYQTTDIFNHMSGSMSYANGMPAPTIKGRLSASGGLRIYPAIGMHIPVNEHFAFDFSAGYQWRRHHYYRENYNELNINYSRISLKIGLLFK